MTASAALGAPRHIVAVTGLIRNARMEILMIDSPRRGWELPGGQVEEGETLIAALGREVREESGIAINVERLAVVHSNLSAPSKVIFGFLCRDAGGTPTPGEESRSVEWVNAEGVLERISHAAVAQRASDLLRSTVGVRYLAYTTAPYEICSIAEFAAASSASAPLR